ncbi:hypothetical protein LMUP508_01979 [Limosilactobacillus mucosae]|mgnify:FL=1|uniref:Uncharacterized protein n=1 Tax=Limosilactobacillus mucosae TaxID=97478 RepID=A0A508YWW2_LIMMU|nr:hypothetical protein LMUP508_01979 [Limosilactobacillus mucosae]
MTTSKIAIKIDAKIYEKISIEVKQNHLNKTEMLEFNLLLKIISTIRS